jgi:two-component system chemotaxis response regulator CheB
MPENLFILPGEMAFCREQTSISTLLGSCVAVTLYDRRHRWGGLNHYMVPEPIGNLPDGKVGRNAIPALVRLATMAGSKIGDLEARVVGGAAVIGASVSGSAAVLGDIGGRNAELATAMLSQLGIPVMQTEVGGNHGRKIRLDSQSGQLDLSSMAGGSAVVQVRAPRRSGERYRVLVIDDSALVRQMLGKVIAASEEFEVCGEAEDPFAASERILTLDPDVLCLDLIMPKLDGLSFLRRLMQYKPIPTVVVSTIAKTGSAMRGKVLEAGAIYAIDKEELRLHGNGEVASRILLPALKRAALSPVSARPQGASR